MYSNEKMRRYSVCFMQAKQCFELNELREMRKTVLHESCSDAPSVSQEERLKGHKHGLINYIDTKAKCRRLKKFTRKGNLWQVFIRVRFYRPKIPSVMLVFSNQLCELLPL